ncbi:hypothetical protein KKA27_03395 [Patescibacteria group bacterium]|nr:hypothetical protein [Patescibacteria group bacterium]MBU2633316.1 hypothetical protein [Patescibacteria group bacterium]
MNCSKTNAFRVADSVALRKRNTAWLSYQEELLEGVSVEDIFWKIVWQIKVLSIVKKGYGSGLHPFVFKKAQKASPLFKEEELDGRFADLVDLYHKNRQGKSDLLIGLEKFILRI